MSVIRVVATDYERCRWPSCGSYIWPGDEAIVVTRGHAHADHYDSYPELDREEGLADMREAVGR